jgi:hypothetical protein
MRLLAGTFQLIALEHRMYDRFGQFQLTVSIRSEGRRIGSAAISVWMKQKCATRMPRIWRGEDRKRYHLVDKTFDSAAASRATLTVTSSLGGIREA